MESMDKELLPHHQEVALQLNTDKGEGRMSRHGLTPWQHESQLVQLDENNQHYGCYIG